MKKRILSLALALALVLAVTGCSEKTEDPIFFEYEYNGQLGGVVLTKYIGTNLDIKIPSKIEGYPVVELRGTFNRITIASVTIPDSVTSIGDSAFAGCASLAEESRRRILQINPDAEF
jgi:hypothetical protein